MHNNNVIHTIQTPPRTYKERASEASSLLVIIIILIRHVIIIVLIAVTLGGSLHMDAIFNSRKLNMKFYVKDRKRNELFFSKLCRNDGMIGQACPMVR